MQVGFSMILEKYLYLLNLLCMYGTQFSVCHCMSHIHVSHILFFPFGGRKSRADCSTVSSHQASHYHFQTRFPTRDRHCRRRCPVRGAAKTVGRCGTWELRKVGEWVSQALSKIIIDLWEHGQEFFQTEVLYRIQYKDTINKDTINYNIYIYEYTYIYCIYICVYIHRYFRSICIL